MWKTFAVCAVCMPFPLFIDLHCLLGLPSLCHLEYVCASAVGKGEGDGGDGGDGGRGEVIGVTSTQCIIPLSVMMSRRLFPSLAFVFPLSCLPCSAT